MTVKYALLQQLRTRVAFDLLAQTATVIGADIDLAALASSDDGAFEVTLTLPGVVYTVWLDRGGRFLWAHSSSGQSWQKALPSVGQPPYTRNDARRDFLAHLWLTHAGQPLPAALAA